MDESFNLRSYGRFSIVRTVFGIPSELFPADEILHPMHVDILHIDRENFYRILSGSVDYVTLFEIRRFRIALGSGIVKSTDRNAIVDFRVHFTSVRRVPRSHCVLVH